MDLKRYMLTKKESIRDLRVEDRDIEAKENKNFIISVIGPRRAGKTYFLYNLIGRRKLSDEDFVFLNFEEPIEIKELDEAIISHYEIYGREPSYIFLDEIQGLRGWERHVYSLYERKRYYIFVTGSSSKLLGREISTQLRGRALPLYVFPFSISEVLRINGIKIRKHYSSYDVAKVRHILSSCLRRGFFPDIVLGNVDPLRFFREYIDLVIYKDIIERFGIRNRHALEFFLRSCISSNASTFSVHKVFNSLKSQGEKISKKTLYAFQRIVEDVNFGFFLKKFGWSRRKIELSMPKFYLVDNGIYSFMEREELGKLLENVVFLELLKRGLFPNENIFYLSFRGYEVDFLVKEGEIKLMQVTYASGRDEIDKKDVEALIKAGSIFKSNELLFVTWDYEDELLHENRRIRLVPLWKWVSEI